MSQLILYFSTPLCTTLSPNVMLLVGQVLAHLRQTLQKSSTPLSTGWSGTSGKSVMIGSGMWTRAPKCLVDDETVASELAHPEATPAACGIATPRSAV